MSLRHKLFFGFFGLIAVVVLIGVHNIGQITDLGQSVDVILRENYRSVIACQKMKETIERMDSGALFIVLGHDKEGRDLIARNKYLFEKALQEEMNNITLPGEGEKAKSVGSLFSQYGQAIETLSSPGGDRQAKHEIYFSKLLPLFRKIKDTADDILRMNQENMVMADVRARNKALSARRQMDIMLLVAVVVSGGFLLLTGRWILRPIKQLIRSANEIKQGNLDLVIQSNSRDEIGQLSRAFNEMAASLREFRRSDRSKLFRYQHSIQHAFNNLPEAIAIVNPEGQVEVATDRAREAFGLKPDIQIEDLPFAWMTSLFKETLTGYHGNNPRTMPGLVQQFVGGEERFYHPKAVAMLDDQKQPAGVILVIQEVTRQIEQDELKRGVISTVSHQLKTPLTSIRMAVYLLLEEKVGDLTPKQIELLVAAREDADRLCTILEKLLDISRIESGKARMDFRALSPRSVVWEALEPFRSTAVDRGIILNEHGIDDLPEIWADMTRIIQVYANLVSNALKYTPAGGEVTVSGETDEEFVMFKVSDTGTGIPEEYLPHIFEQFFRVPDQTEEAGTGLGLYIAKDIVEAHGGTIRAESRPGAGTTFSFTVKRAERAAGPSKEVAQS